MFESVLFPAPFSPSSACTSPAAASKSTASFARTPGKRFVIDRIATAAPCGAAVAGPASAVMRFTSRRRRRKLAGRLDVRDGPDHAPDEPLHRVERVDPGLRARVEALALLDAQLAGLVVDRAAEGVELARDDLRPLLRDRRLRLRRDLRAVRGEAGEAVLDRSVVEARLPG